MKRLHRFAIRHPLAVVVAALAVVIAIAPGIARLRLRTDGHALVPEHAPEVQLDRAVRREFGLRDPLVVLIRPRDPAGIFNSRTLRLVSDLTVAFAKLPGLDSADVRSLATEPSDHFQPGTLRFRRLLEPPPVTPARLDELRGDIAAIGLLTGTFVSFDGSATAIHLGTPPEGDRTALVAAVHGAIAGVDTAGHAIDVIGAPVAEALLGSHILEDLGISSRWLGRPPERFADADATGLGLLARLRLAIARHLGLLPLSLLVMALVFVLTFRNLTATLLPLMEAGACLVFVFGLMGWVGVPVYLTMAVLPVILVSMGLADEIHVFACFRRRRATAPEAPIRDVVGSAMDEMCLPVIATALTTAIGFLSFAISPLEPVRAFGLFTAIGIAFCMLWTLTVIPALLVLREPGALRARDVSRSNAGPTALAASSAAASGWQRFARLASGRPALMLVLALGALAASPLGIRRLVVQDSWIGGFARESAFYRATQYFNRNFFGAHRLLLAIDTGAVDVRGTVTYADIGFLGLSLPDPGVAPERLQGAALVVSRRAPVRPTHDPAEAMRAWTWESRVDSARVHDGRVTLAWPPVHGSPLLMLNPTLGETLDVAIRSERLARPEALQHVDRLERFARARADDGVGGVLGPVEWVTTAQFLVDGRDPESRAIPSDPDRVRWLWDEVGVVQGERRVRAVVDSSFRRGVVEVFLRDANFVGTRRLMEALRRHESHDLAPAGIRFDFAGDVAVSQTLIEAIVRSQVGSLLISLLGILAVTALAFRSLRWGVLCMVPAAAGITTTFAVMGWTGTPLGVATSMFASMSLGIGVDFAIHLIERFRSAIAAGAERRAAIVDALAVTGPPIVVNALAVALGFGILMLSRVPANARLGQITVISLLTCVAATLLVMPALLEIAGGAGTKNRGGDPIGSPPRSEKTSTTT